MDSRRVGAVVLAAGEGSRMGQVKPLLPWPTAGSSTTLLDYALEQLTRAGVVQIVVVTGHEAEHIESHLCRSGVTAVRNSRPEDGKASSVRVGVAHAADDLDAILVVGADQPRPAWLIHQLIGAHVLARPPVSVPTYQRKWGHPPLFDAALRPQLLEVREETQGLRPVVRGQYPRVLEVDVGSALALVNLNRPDDYAAAMDLFAREGRHGDT